MGKAEENLVWSPPSASWGLADSLIRTEGLLAKEGPGGGEGQGLGAGATSVLSLHCVTLLGTMEEAGVQFFFFRKQIGLLSQWEGNLKI